MTCDPRAIVFTQVEASGLMQTYGQLYPIHHCIFDVFSGAGDIKKGEFGWG